jgi:hypothetical protein
MENFTKHDLKEAARAITSLLHKCEKVQEKLKQGTSQYTLTNNRIKAFQVALALIEKELADS